MARLVMEWSEGRDRDELMLELVDRISRMVRDETRQGRPEEEEREVPGEGWR